MKIAILKQILDVFGPWSTFEYKNYANTPGKILDTYHSKTNSFETFLLFEADHIVVDTFLPSKHQQQTVNDNATKRSIHRLAKGAKSIDDIDFGKYDIVWTRDPILVGHIDQLKAKYPKTLFAYELIEHWCKELHAKAKGYDLFLDHNNYSMSSAGNSISFPYPRCPTKLRQIFRNSSSGSSGSGSSVYIDWRDKDNVPYFQNNLKDFKVCATAFSAANSKNNGIFLRLDENPDEQHEYFRRLAECKYFISIAGRLGQSLVDAASLKCICIGTKKSGNHRLICHPSCFVNTPAEAVAKINEIESNSTLQNEILTYQDLKINEYFVNYPIASLKQKLAEKHAGTLEPITVAVGSKRRHGGVPAPMKQNRRRNKMLAAQEAAAAQQRKPHPIPPQRGVTTMVPNRIRNAPPPAPLKRNRQPLFHRGRNRHLAATPVAPVAPVVTPVPAQVTAPSQYQPPHHLIPGRPPIQQNVTPQLPPREIVPKEQIHKLISQAPHHGLVSSLGSSLVTPYHQGRQVNRTPPSPSIKINYIISCNPNKCAQGAVIEYGTICPTDQILSTHLKSLGNCKLLQQITIVNSTPLPPLLNDTDVNSKIIVVLSKSSSIYARFLEAYKKCPDFDYYIITSDEYFAAADNFDVLLFNKYIKTIGKENGGYLCSRVFTKPTPHAAHSPGIIHRSVFERLLQKTPMLVDLLSNMKNFRDQVMFSTKILESGFKICDFSDEYSTPFFKAPSKILNCSINSTSQECIFAPIQMYNNTSPSGLSQLTVLQGS